MKNLIRGSLILLLTLVIGLQIAIGEDQQTPVDNSEPLPLDELRTFTEVFSRIKNDYVEPVSDKKLLEDAIRGMLAGLDPHSTYLDKESYEELQEGTTGEFGGLGIEVGMEDGFVKVISPIDDTPAYKAGIKAGDLIIKLDETPVKGMSLNDAINKMRGKPGTDIKLTIVRQGTDKPLEITITRAIIKTKSVRAKTLAPGYGYLRISSFQANTGKDLRTELDKLKQENNNQLKGLILDLRNNPGGVLNAAVDVSDLFLSKGLIVYTEGRIKDSKLRFNAKPVDDLPDNTPLVVLVNEGSASASEIVAGALQDNNRAVIVGQKTFGKGSVQTILPISNDTAVKLTTARYYTPSGRSIQNSGIQPDVIIDRVSVKKFEDDSGGIIKEADLSGHLENDQVKKKSAVDQAADKAAGTGNEAKKDEIPLSISDYELYEAFNILKGIAAAKQAAK